MKQRTQAGQFSSSVAALTHLWSRRPSALFAGYTAMLQREIPFGCIQFVLFEQLKALKAWGTDTQGQVSASYVAACGSVAGGITGFLTNPLDVLKTRRMTGSLAQSSRSVTLRAVVEEEGIRSLFAGAGARVAWLSLGGAIFFGAFEAVRGQLHASASAERQV